MIRIAPSLCGLLFLASPAPGQFQDLVGEQPPELIVADNGWVNWEGEPISLEGLLGHVVWIEFSFVQ